MSLIKEIQEIINLFERHSVTELALESNGTKITLKKSSSNSVLKQLKKATSTPISPYIQTSKLVGTFRKMLVEVNDFVKKNQPIAQIEVLKMINDVLAETEGVVLKVLVENDEPVEYDQPIIEIQPQPKQP